MDRERLGRVLGRGARLAARTAVEAVDAATAPTPNQYGPQVVDAAFQKKPAHQQPGRVPVRAAQLARSLRPAAAAARAGALTPLRRASRELWHELTGSFFALFGLSFGVGVWHTRANAFSSLPADRYRFSALCALTLLFAYFSISSFTRARRRSLS